MFRFVILASLLSAILVADCHIEKNGQVAVGFTAFKTAAKIGVGGKFDKVSTEGMDQGQNVFALLKGAKAHVVMSSVNTKNKGRDATLVENFFNKMRGDLIEATVLSVDEKSSSMVVGIAMNAMSYEVPLKLKSKVVAKNVTQYKAVGTIDLFDFKASEALHSINKACYVLHKGKTWNDVDVYLTFQTKKVCTY